MKLSLFNYNLPQKLIAQKPHSPRDHSRLMVFDRKNNKIYHKKFYQITEFLRPGDLLIFNDSKVIPARLIGKKTETGGKMEVLLLKEIKSCFWECLIGGRSQKKGLKISLKMGLEAVLIRKMSNRTWLVKFNYHGKKLRQILAKTGQMPLPPYISSKTSQNRLKKQYQTVYAKYPGSAAAPTAGFHFTKRLLKKIKEKGCDIGFVTLHVGLATFAPVKTEDIKEHQMHSEWVSVKKDLVQKIKKSKNQKNRIIAVGTTSVRTLEAVLPKLKKVQDFQGEVNIFIYPGYKFKVVDAMITNFHLPKSTLLMLVSAFIGRKKTLELYQLAVKKKYRFYSFGDGMFIV